MTSNGSARLQTSGNTKPRSYASKRWVFTWNNYPSDYWLQISASLKKGDKYIMGEEVGEEGTPHIQGYIEFETKCRPIEKIGIPQIHWEKAIAKREQNFVYCSKGNNIRQNIKIVPTDPLNDKTLYEWQKKVLDIVEQKPDERTIHWFWEPEGCSGKTSLVKHLVIKKDALIVGGKGNDIKYAVSEFVNEGNQPKIILLNLTRSMEEYLSYESLEAVKDGIFFSGKYESKQCVYDCPHVICFANFEPAKEKLSLDRWNIIRIKTLKKYDT